jgi:acetyl esterase/lipase
VNECDPLRDEGIEFYRLLLDAGVPARCKMSMGTMHGTEIFPIACPELSADPAGLTRLLAQGADQARVTASATLARAQAAVGLR